MLRLSLRRRSAIAVGFLVLTSAGPRGVVAPQVTAFARPYASFEAIGPEDPGASSCAFAAQPTKGQHTASSSAFPQIDAGLALASTEQGLLSNEYAISYQAGAASYQSPNSAQGYRVAYRTDGIELIARGGKAQWHVGLDLERIGRAEEWLVPLPNPGMRVLGAILVADHETFAIDYVNDARGVRQNFTVRIRPVGSGSLQVRLQVDASLRPVAEGHNTIAFKDQRDSIVVSYTDLHVWDANGDTLPASMVLKDDDIVLIVDDRDADYPIVVDPLLPSGWTVESDQANSDFGACVASAGDVNGDGFSDVIVGARLFDNAQADEGRVFVYHGSANGLSVSANWTAESDQVDAYFGTSVSTAGDVNGDGYSDVIIGAPGAA
ncbi:MAG: integrin alpha, partial [Flavobacteriales bacterium]